MRIILDTNVYIAALKEQSLSYKILEIVFKEETGFFIYTSSDLKHELFQKLEEWKKKGLADIERINRLKFLVDNFIPAVAPKERVEIITEDPDDNRVLECAMEANANIIVTMDRDLLKLKHFRNIPIMHPKTFSFLMPKS